jgi:hypothetical protein
VRYWSPPRQNPRGRGGGAKTTLLRAFARLARPLARPVLLVDGHDLDATPAAFLSAVSTAPMEPAPAVRRPPIASTDEVVAYLNATRPLLLIDTFEALGAIGRYLREELLPRLDRDIRVVIAGRYPLAPAWGDAWSRLIRPIALTAFSHEESRLYLERRGIVDRARQARILDVAAGHPLALSLAADLALQPGSGDFATDPSWKLAAHGLVERLLRDVLDDDLRCALEVASIVRQFDEATLVAISDRPIAPSTFDRLCRLSFVRPSEHGLALHDDVRRILNDDLRWRDRARSDELRQRALAMYRRRTRTAPPQELFWLVGERLFLWEDAFAQQWMYNDDEPGRLWVELTDARDLPDIVTVWERWLAEVVPAAGRVPLDHHDLSADRATLEALVRNPGVTVEIARTQAGRPVALGMVLAVCRQSLQALPPDSLVARVLTAYLDWAKLPALPERPEESTIWYCSTLAQIGEQPFAEAGAMIRWCLGFIAGGGTFIFATADSLYREWTEILGATRIPELTMDPWHDEYPVAVMTFELAAGDADAWMEAITTGQRPPRRLTVGEIRRELQEILPRWRDDERLRTSLLADVLRDEDGQPIGPRPDRLRQAIRAALALARETATVDQALAYRALELAYLDVAGSRVDAAHQLAVSRRTFYRLLERATHDLAARLRG